MLDSSRVFLHSWNNINATIDVKKYIVSEILQVTNFYK